MELLLGLVEFLVTKLPLILVVLTLGAYIMGLSIFLSNRHVNEGEAVHKYKIIPAELVLTTVPINIGLSMNPDSAYKLIANEQIRGYLAMALVFIAIIVYIWQLSYGKKLQSRNGGSPFCNNLPDKLKLFGMYAVAGLFILVSVQIAMG